VEAVPRGEEHPVGVVLRDGDREACRQPAAGLGPRGAVVVRDRERRPAVDDRDDRRAGPRGRDDARKVDVGCVDLGQLGPLCERDLLLDVDEHDALDRLDGRGQLARLRRSAATSAVARRAAEAGECPLWRAERYAAAKASPAPVGSTSPPTGRAGISSASPFTITTDPRSPRVSTTSGTPRSASASTAPPVSTSASSSDTLRIDTWRSTSGS